MKRFQWKKSTIAEIVVVSLVLILLLIVMIPKFKNAQILTKVTEAKMKLKKVEEAMKA